MPDSPAPSSLRDAVDALLRDDDLARLDALTSPFDPLAVMGWSARERAHTRLLAWLLDPRARSPERAHGFGLAPLRALLKLCLDASEAAAPQGEDDLRVWCEERLGDGLRATARAPDLRCEWSDAGGSPWVLLLEDKLDAAEGDEQLADYLGWMRRHRPGCRRLLVYLTPDGRAPTSLRDAPELRVLRWGALASALDAALPDGRDDDALRFARACLRALAARFDAPAEVRALLARLGAAHPEAVESLGPDGDPELRRGLVARFPAAAARLKTFAPKEVALGREWAERVRDAFNSLALQRYRMTVGSVGESLSWSFDGVTDRVGLHALVWPGHRLGVRHARWLLALHAPNRSVADAVRERDQAEALEALGDETRGWLLAATPLREAGETWKWLRLSEPLPLPRGVDDASAAARFAEALRDALGAHLDALGRAFASPSTRLYSVDLDLEHLVPVDVRDREALHAEARSDARHAVVLGPRRADRPEALRAAASLGGLFAETYGGTGALSYDYDGALALGLAGRGRPLTVIRLDVLDADDAPRLRARFKQEGDVVLLGEPSDAARAALGAVLDGCGSAAPCDDDDRERPITWLGVASTLRDLRGLGRRWRVTASPIATVAAATEGDPVVLAWRSGPLRVVLLAAQVDPLRGLPERFGRWFRALLGALEPLAEPVTSAAPAPAPMPRRALAPAVARGSGQAVLPWGASPRLPRGARADAVIESLDDVVIVDTETTGLSSSARIVEIGALHVRGGSVVGQFQTFVDPEEPIPRAVIRVHGITDAMVKGSPTAGDAIRAWQRFAAGRPVLAHNAAFDHRMFAQDAARVGLGRLGLAFWCTRRFAKAAFPKAPGYGLAKLSAWLKLPSPPTHRAVADCATTHGLLAACRAVSTDAELSGAHGPPKPL
ncbi:MAG: exonuclease domain-containing protein [Polyangiales bacterium]